MDGRADRVTVKIYTPGMTLVHVEEVEGPFVAGWSYVSMELDFSNGQYTIPWCPRASKVRSLHPLKEAC